MGTTKTFCALYMSLGLINMIMVENNNVEILTMIRGGKEQPQALNITSQDYVL